MLIVWAVLAVGLKPGRAAKGVGRDEWSGGSVEISRRLPASVTRISPWDSEVLSWLFRNSELEPLDILLF